MEANDAWDHFLEAYGDMKRQRDSLINTLLHTIEVLERDGYKQPAEFIKDQLKRVQNGDESISNSFTGNESKSGT